MCLVAVAVIPGGVLLLSAAATLRGDLVADVNEDLTAAARLGAERLHARFEVARGALDTFARVPAVRRHDGVSCGALAARILESESMYRNLGAASRDGTVFCAALPGPEPFNVADRLYFRRALQAPYAVTGEYVVSRVAGRPAIHVAHAVLADDGAVEGVVSASIDVGHLAELVRGVLPRPHATITVFDENGTILSRHPDHDRWVGSRYDSVVGRRIDPLREEIGEATGPGGERLLYASAPVALSEKPTGLAVSVSIPRTVALARADRVFSRTLAWYVFVALTSFAAAWILGEFGFVRHIRQLASAARRLNRGDLATRSGLSRRSDELGDLGAAFDEMASTLQQRSHLEHQVRRLQKMEALGRLAAGIAHDFNNLLTVILSTGKHLRGELPHGDLRTAAEDIVGAGRRGAELTRQLLAFSRHEVVEPKLVDPNAVIDDLRTLLARLVGREVVSSFSLSARGSVFVDPAQLEQVIINFAVNARDAMPAGGRLSIATADVELDGAANGCRLGARAGKYVMIAVSDDGLGMDEDTQARLFEPFFTTKERDKGTGLGLSTVWGIVHTAGGDISVSSAVAKGSTFKVFLPRVESAIEPDDVAAA